MINQPYPSFIDPEVGGRAKPVSNGTIFIGQNQKDAIQFPEKVYYTDSEGTEIEMDQPIYLNSAGVTVASKNSSTVVSPYTKSASYSILIRNSGGNKRYINESVSGSATKGWVESGEAKITATGTTTPRSLKDRFADVVNVKDFGAVGDGVADDSTAIQAAIDSLIRYGNKGPGEGFTFSAVVDKLVFPKGVYALGAQLEYNEAYFDIDFGGSLFIPTESFNQSTYAFNMPNAWWGNAKMALFRGFDNVIRIENANAGLGHMTFSNIDVSGAIVFLDVTCRSSRVLVKDSRMDEVTHPAILHACDFLQFDECWLKPGVVQTDYTGMFRLLDNSFAPRLKITNMFYNPTPQTARDVSLVEARDPQCQIEIVDSLFGGEAGQVPAVMWFGDSTSVTTSGRGGYIKIVDSSYYSASSSPTNDPTGRRAMVELYALPNTIIMENLSGLPEGSDQRGMIFFREDFQTLADAKAFNADTQIWFDNRVLHRGDGGYLVDDAKNLSEFVHSENPVHYYVAEGVTNTNRVEIEVPKYDNRLRRMFRITLSADSTSTADSCSEYLIQSGFTEGIIAIMPIYEGASLSAPRLLLDTGAIYVLTNGNVSSVNYAVSLQKITTPTSGF